MKKQPPASPPVGLAPVRLAHVRLDAVGHRFRRHGPPVLADVSLTIASGEAVALVGRSGCGKSTLLHIMAGLLKPHHGRVLIGGERVRNPSARWNMMFQSPSLFPWMTVAENVGLGLRFAGVNRATTRDRVAELLDLVHLADHAGDNVQTLSGGQQQRAALARSLATRPEILLLDEPFSALDTITRATLQSEVRAIARRLNLTLIIVTHDIDEAVLMADRALVMAPRPGRVVAEVAFDLPAERDRTSPAFAAARQALLAPFHAGDGPAPDPANAAPVLAPLPAPSPA